MSPSPGSPASDALDAQLTPTEQAQAAAEGAAAGGAGGAKKEALMVPWFSAAHPTRKAIDKARTRKFTNDTQASAWEAELRRHGFAGEPSPAPPHPDTLMLTGKAMDDAREAYRRWEAEQSGQANLGPIGSLLKDAEDVQLEVLRMSDKERADLGARLVAVGMLEEGYNKLDLKKAWAQLVGDAVDENLANPQAMLTPYDMIDNYKAADGSDTGPGGTPKLSNAITRDVQLTTNADARKLLRSMMSAGLGRMPTSVEVDRFQARLNAAQSANPTVTTRTGADDGTTSTVSNIQTGGIDPQGFAQDEVISTDPESEYGRYQQATTYTNALLAAIRGPGGA